MIERTDKSRDAVFKTGKAFFIGFSAIALVLFVRSTMPESENGWDISRGVVSTGWRWFLSAGIILFLLSRYAYPVMRPVHVGWMIFAFALGWFNTRLLLGLMFYGILTPMGLIMRLFGKDFLGEKIRGDEKSHWIKRERKPFDPSELERPF